MVFDARVRGSAPAVFSGLIPWGVLPGFGEGATLEGVAAFTTRYDHARGVWPGGLDGTRGGRAGLRRPPGGLLGAAGLGRGPRRCVRPAAGAALGWLADRRLR